MNVRSTGRIVAGVLFTLVAGVIFMAVRNQQRAAEKPPPIPPVPPGPNGSVGVPGEVNQPGVLSSAERGTWTRVDPHTGAVASRLSWEHLTPLPDGWFELTSPESIIYSEGHLKVRTTAPKGKVQWRQREEPPESGEMTGGVVIRYYPQGGPDPEHTPPHLEETIPGTSLYRLDVASLRFQQALSQVDSDDAVAIAGPGLQMNSTGVVLRISPITHKLQYLRTTGKLATIVPDEFERGVAAPARDPSAKQANAGDPSAATVYDLDTYLATLSGDVALTQGERSIHADSAEVRAVLLDGRLQKDAIAPLRSPHQKEPVASASASRAPTDKPTSAADQTQPITIAYTGPLEVTLLQPGVKESDLGAEKARVAFRAKDPGGVHVADAALDLTAAQLDYGATTRALAIHGSNSPLGPAKAGPGERIAVRMPDGMSLDAADIKADLTTGVGSIEGAGGATIASPGRAPVGVSWTTRCDYILDTSAGPVGGGAPVNPKEITLTDGVRAFGPDGVATAEFARVLFAPPPAGASDTRAALSRIILREKAAAAGVDHSFLTGDELVVTFAPPSGGAAAASSGSQDTLARARPSLVSATGHARAQQNGESITADALTARMAANAASAPKDNSKDTAATSRVEHFDAEGSVAYTGSDGVETSSDRLSSDVAPRKVQLVGAPAVIRRRAVGPSPTADSKPGEARTPVASIETLSAERINLDGLARTITVDGPGQGTYEQAAPPVAAAASSTTPLEQPERLNLRWNKSMAYDDKAGRAEFNGAVTIDTARRLGNRDNARADKVIVSIAPLDAAGHAPAKRDLKKIELFGHGDSPNTGWALAQSRRFDLDAAGAPTADLQGRMDLCGETISADPLTHALSVPGPGVLAIVDRRGAQEIEAAPPADASRTQFNSRGDTLVQWKGGLDSPPDPAISHVRIDGDVLVRHLPPGGTTAMVLNCDTLLTTIDWQTPPDPSKPAPATSPDKAAPKPEPHLSTMDAQGSIFVVAMQTKVRGATMHYDAGTNQVIVRGDGATRANVLDEKTGNTATADTVVLNPVTGDWRTEGAGPVTLPR